MIYYVQIIFIAACIGNVIQKNTVWALVYYCLAFGIFFLGEMVKRQAPVFTGRTGNVRFFSCIIPTTQKRRGKQKVMFITVGVDKKGPCEDGSTLYKFWYKDTGKKTLGECEFKSYSIRYEDIIAEFIKEKFKCADFSGKYLIKEQRE